MPDPPRKGRPLILIAMPDSAPFQVVRAAVIRELQDEFDVATRIFAVGSALAAFAAPVAELRPSCLLLMDNPVLALYRAYAESRPPGQPAPPAVVAMTPFFVEELRRIPNTTGVSYEVPGVTAFIELRAISARPVRRVGVVHRQRFRPFIERQRLLAAREDIVLVPFEIDNDPSAADVRAALSAARQSSIDALWVINDRALLRSARFIQEVWRPQILQFPVPVIVGLTTLVSGATRFATFAVVPDHEELGVQTARLIFRVAESGFRADVHPMELPISTLTIANLARLRQQGGLRADAASRVDEVVE